MFRWWQCCWWKLGENAGLALKMLLLVMMTYGSDDNIMKAQDVCLPPRYWLRGRPPHRGSYQQIFNFKQILNLETNLVNPTYVRVLLANCASSLQHLRPYTKYFFSNHEKHQVALGTHNIVYFATDSFAVSRWSTAARHSHVISYQYHHIVNCQSHDNRLSIPHCH